MTYIISKGKKKITYQDNNIIKKYRGNDERRKNLLIQLISINPNIQHTHLLQMTLHFGESSAKRPYEELLNQLEKDNILQSEKIGKSSNSARLWNVVTAESLSELQDKSKLKKLLDSQADRLKEITSILPHMTDYQKAMMLSMLLKSSNENLLTAKFGSKVLNMEHYVKPIEKYEDQIFSIMKNNPNCLKYIPNILESFQILTLKILTDMLDELSNKKS